MRTRFYIEKRRDANGQLITSDCPVFMSITFGGNRIISGTGVKLDLSGWDPDLQRVQTAYPGYQGLNNALDSIQKIAARTMDALEHSGKEVNPGNFRQLFQQLKPKYSSGFFDLFFQFMESNSPLWSNATYRKVRSLFNLLRAFRDQSGYPIAFHNLDAIFLDRFVTFCTERGYKPSTIYKTVNNLVWFLNWSTDRGYNVYRDYRQFYKLMEVPEVSPSMPIYLRWDELMRMMEYSTDSRRMERAKDLFCFMCFAGLRFSEIQNLKKEDLKPGEIVVRRPGGGFRFIPMNSYAAQISQKYENRFYLNNTAFPSMSIITMNKYLRIAGMELGLTREVSADSKQKASLPLYSCLTAGIAVNTFIRNALEMDIPVEIIAGFTGVQNDSRLRKMKSDLAVKEMRKFNA
jgi:site-specific recombinase XerD